MNEVEEFRIKMGFKEPWIGVDLDGVLAKSDVEDLTFSYARIGEPIWEMVNRVKLWISEGKTVKIFTARVEGGEDAEWCIWRWLVKVGLPDLEITNIKDSGMVELWDDLAVNVVLNTGRPKGYYKNWKFKKIYGRRQG